MTYSNLLIFVEGPDDKRFFEKIIVPLLKKKYSNITVWSYANECKEKVKGYLKSIVAMSDEYILTADIDNSPCISSKIGWICEKFDNSVNPQKTVIIINEIESWYLCGIKPDDLRKIGIRKNQCKKIQNKNCATKEQFERIIPDSSTRTNFLISVLDIYDLQQAKSKNQSLNYFYEKWVK